MTLTDRAKEEGDWMMNETIPRYTYFLPKGTLVHVTRPIGQFEEEKVRVHGGLWLIDRPHSNDLDHDGNPRFGWGSLIYLCKSLATGTETAFYASEFDVHEPEIEEKPAC